MKSLLQLFSFKCFVTRLLHTISNVSLLALVDDPKFDDPKMSARILRGGGGGDFHKPLVSLEANTGVVMIAKYKTNVGSI